LPIIIIIIIIEARFVTNIHIYVFSFKKMVLHHKLKTVCVAIQTFLPKFANEMGKLFYYEHSEILTKTISN
jgi:hypothetical protein